MNKWFNVDEKTIGIKYKLYGEYITLLFDKEDYSLVSKLIFKVCTNGYVQCREKLTKNKYVMYHDLLINPPINKEIDHINGIKWDNRKINLRICTHAQNQKNSKSLIKKYKGVYKDNFTIPGKIKYYAQIKVNGKNKHIAYCKSEREAAIAYNEAARKYHGEFACLNIIE